MSAHDPLCAQVCDDIDDGDLLAIHDSVTAHDGLVACTPCGWYCSCKQLAEARRDALAGAVQRVEAIHRHYENGLTGGSCSVCGGRWPCETVAAIVGGAE